MHYLGEFYDLIFSFSLLSYFFPFVMLFFYSTPITHPRLSIFLPLSSPDFFFSVLFLSFFFFSFFNFVNSLVKNAFAFDESRYRSLDLRQKLRVKKERRKQSEKKKRKEKLINPTIWPALASTYALMYLLIYIICKYVHITRPSRYIVERLNEKKKISIKLKVR